LNKDNPNETHSPEETKAISEVISSPHKSGKTKINILNGIRKLGTYLKIRTGKGKKIKQTTKGKSAKKNHS
jgi:hypothetical protein